MQAPSIEGLIAHLRGRVAARAVADSFRQQGENELADRIQMQATYLK